jgi:hypothetical protein
LYRPQSRDGTSPKCRSRSPLKFFHFFALKPRGVCSHLSQGAGSVRGAASPRSLRCRERLSGGTRLSHSASLRFVRLKAERYLDVLSALGIRTSCSAQQPERCPPSADVSRCCVLNTWFVAHEYRPLTQPSAQSAAPLGPPLPPPVQEDPTQGCQAECKGSHGDERGRAGSPCGTDVRRDAAGQIDSYR